MFGAKLATIDGASNRTRTCDTHGQKYGRFASLGALATLPISSCSSHPFIVHRTRGTMNQLTAALRLPETQFHGLNFFLKRQNKNHPIWVVSVLAPQTGLEPVTPSVRNMVDLLRLERSQLSLFLPVHRAPSSSTGRGAR